MSPNHFCWDGHEVMVIFVILDEKEDPSFVPMGDDSQADVKVALGLRIELNCM